MITIHFSKVAYIAIAYSIVLDIHICYWKSRGISWFATVSYKLLLDLLPGAGGKDETLTGGRRGPGADDSAFSAFRVQVT